MQKTKILNLAKEAINPQPGCWETRWMKEVVFTVEQLVHFAKMCQASGIDAAANKFEHRTLCSTDLRRMAQDLRARASECDTGHNVEFSGATQIHRGASAGTEGSTAGDSESET